MRYRRNLRLSATILMAHPLRTSLTVLGVLVGVAVLVIVVSIGNGMNLDIQDSFRAMGSDLLVVRAGQVNMHHGHPHQMTLVTTLTLDDAESIAKVRDQVSEVAPAIARQLPIKSSFAATQTRVEAMTPGGFGLRGYEAEWGRLYGTQEEGARRTVAVLGSTVARSLFGETDPVGQMITIGRLTFSVIGVTRTKGSDLWGSDMDDVIFIPLDTGMKRLFHAIHVETIYVRSFGEEMLGEAEASLTELLRQRHRIRPGRDNDFTVQNQLSFMEASVETLDTSTRVVMGVAGISLLVAGIGILAVMLMTVRERRWEIGLRRAVGATSGDIAGQFLMEATLLTLAGGALGVALALGAVELTDSQGWARAVFSVPAALIGGGVSAFIGVTFGLYPALRASRLEPIVALNAPN